MLSSSSVDTAALAPINEKLKKNLNRQITKDEWKPDFGPSEFVPWWGATATGVRKFLIAFNINVLGTKEQAHRIALNLREQGRGSNEPGRIKAVQW